jgi:asparagine synthase (glutamine-hydrolysing)
VAEALFAGAFSPDAPGEAPLRVAPTSALSSAPGDPEISCVVDGELSNRRELARGLGLSEETPDEVVIAAAYRRDDQAMLAELAGGWAIALWDARTGRGLLARDRGGARPLFLFEHGRRLLFASELRDLLPMLERRPAPDEVALAHLLVSNRQPAGRTLFDGVRPLVPGTFVSLAAEGWRMGTYWAPSYAAPARIGASEATERARAALASAVARDLPERGEAGVLLSGGLDSSAIAGLAAEQLAPARRLRLYSAVFPRHEKLDESPWIAAVSEHLAAPVTQVAVGGLDVIAGLLSYLDAWEVPPPSPNYAVWAPLLTRAKEEGTEAVLDGHGGDELFGLDPWLMADRLRRGNVPGAVALARSMPDVGRDWRTTARAMRVFGLRGAAPPRLHGAIAALRPPPERGPRLLRPRAHALLAEGPGAWDWKAAHGPRWWRHLTHALFDSPRELGVRDYLRRRASSAGLRSGQPLMDPDLAGAVLALPPALAFDHEHDRPLLRAAVRGAVPELVLARTVKPTFNALADEALGNAQFDAVRGLLDPSAARIREWVEPDALAGLLSDRPQGPGLAMNRWSRAVWRLLSAECWLRAEERR